MSEKSAENPHRDSGHLNRSVERSAEIQKCFASDQELLGLSEIASRCNLAKATAFRIICTLVKCGILSRRDKNLYALAIQSKRQRKYHIGYASQSEEFCFSRLVSDSIRRNAYESGVDLLVLNNRYSPKVAVKNAETFVREGVSLVIEFQTNEHSAAIISSILMEANIPIIAIEIPHPGAVYYGANNFRAGMIGGRYLAQICLNQWGGKFDELLLLELPMAGQLPRSRLAGIVAGIRELIPKFPDQHVTFLNGNGQYDRSLEMVRRYLKLHKGRRVLVSGMNDPSCIGAMRAFEEAGLADHCFVVGQNASIEARHEMRASGSCFVGSVGYFPESYGEKVIAMALDILNGNEIPPAVFVQHQMITAKNVDQFYPNDRLIPAGDVDSMLFSSR